MFVCKSGFRSTADRRHGFLFAGVACFALSGALPAFSQTYTATNQAAFDTALGNANGGGTVQVNASFNVTNPANGTNVSSMPITLGTNTLGISGLGGTGGLAVSSGGAGVLNLTGTNTFQGGLTASSIIVSADGDAALGQGVLTLNSAAFRAAADFDNTHGIVVSGQGATIETNGHALTLSGTIDGAGTVFNIVGGGTVTATGANTFTSQVGVIQSTLSVASATALGLGTSAINLESGTLQTTATMGLGRNIALLTGYGVIDAAGGTTLTLGGVISGANQVLKLPGSGTVVLNGVNLYSGGSQITGGTVVMGNARALGPGAIQVSNATVQAGADMTVTNAFNAASGTIDNGGHVLTLSGALSGVGAFAGAGTTILTGASTGPTTISSGTLQVGAGGTTGSLGAGAVANNGTLAFNRSDAVTLANAITGSGALTQMGAGRLVLNAVNTYGGGTTVTRGELQVGDAATPTASIAGDASVNAGATLSGHGSIGGNVTNNGIVSPGGSVGILTVGGNYTSNAASQLFIQVTPAEASLLKVGGAATLGGTLTLAYAPGVYTAKSYPLVQAGSLTGTFATVAETGATPTALTRTVNYSSTAATLTLTDPGASTPNPPATDPPSPPPPPPVVVVTPADDAVFGSVQTVLATGGHSALGLLLDRKADPADEACLTPSADAPQGGTACQKGQWVRAFGQFSQVNGQGANPGFTTRGGGFLAGASQEVDGGVVGLAGGYQRTDLTDSSGGHAAADSLRFSVYAARSYGPAVLSAAAGYAWNHVTSRRAAGPFDASATYDVHEIDGGLQAAAPLRLGAATLTPKVGLRMVELLQNRFSERAPGDFAVTGHAANLDSLQPFVGATLSRGTDWQGGALTPEIRVGYRHELLDTNGVTDVRSATGFDFVAASTAPGRDIVSAGAGVTFLKAGRLAASANYDADFARDAVNQTVSVGLRLRF